MKSTFRQILIAITLVLLASGCAGKGKKGGGGGDGPGPGGGGGDKAGRRQNNQNSNLADVLGLNEQITELKERNTELERQLDQVFGPNALNNQGNINGFNTGGSVNPDNFGTAPLAGNAPPVGPLVQGQNFGAPLPGDLGAIQNPATGGSTKGGVVQVGSAPGDTGGFTASASRCPASVSADGLTHKAP